MAERHPGSRLGRHRGAPTLRARASHGATYSKPDALNERLSPTTISSVPTALCSDLGRRHRGTVPELRTPGWLSPARSARISTRLTWNLCHGETLQHAGPPEATGCREPGETCDGRSESSAHGAVRYRQRGKRPASDRPGAAKQMTREVMITRALMAAGYQGRPADRQDRTPKPRRSRRAMA
jgi:hypothetical protein